MLLDPINIGAVLVVIVSAGGAWLTQRTMAKSQRLSAKDTAEVEAYNRARAMDLQTIKRQDEEIADLTKDCEALRKRLALSEKENEDMRIIIRALRRRGSEENHG